MEFKQLTVSEAKIHYRYLTQELYNTPHLFFEGLSINHYGLFDEGQAVCLGSIFKTKKDCLITLGNFQCINDIEVSKEFFNQLFRILNSKGHHELIGPMHGSTWLPYRFSEELNNPFYTEYIHKKYYPKFWRASGFEISKKYYSNIAAVDKKHKNQLLSRYFEQNNFRIQRINSDTNIETIKAIYEFVNSHFNRNSFFTTLPFKQFITFGQSYIQLFKGEFSQLVYDENLLIGIFLAANDTSAPNQAIVRTIARHPNKKYEDLAIEMSQRFYLQLIEKSYDYQIHAYFYENNPSRKVSENFGGEILREHFLYSVKLK